MNTNFTHSILHVDADAFFVSCEEARRPDLKNKPVVTGLERGIISALNYKAKSYGLKRAMPVFEAKKICPNLIFLPADYRSYSLYSERMFKIMRRFCSAIEEYSIDECFADLSGFENKDELVLKIKKTLDKELGISFSLGLAPTKVLAKIASNWRKPNGLTIINENEIDNYLNNLDLEKIWGIGSKTKEYLNNLGVNNALEFAKKDYDFIKQLAKPYREIWQELKGELVYLVNSEKKLNHFSISKTKTFKKSSDYNYIFSHLSENLELACIKLRAYNLKCSKVSFFLKRNDLKIYDYQFSLNSSSHNPIEILKYINNYFLLIYKPQASYRASGVILSSLRKDSCFQDDLFGVGKNQQKISHIFKQIDKISQRYGRNSIFLASSLKARNDLDYGKKSLNIPYLGKCL
jgi:DNA polymerase IV